MSSALSHQYSRHERLLSRLQRSSRPAIAAALAGLLMPMPMPMPVLAQQADGEQLFRQRCGACHSIDAGQKKSGPHLAGVTGRASGSIEGARYSRAMQEAGIVWNDETLDAFLAAPRRMVPGTTMTVAVPDAAQRAAIITYLAKQ